jgi:GT2 family glycosyltransferase
MKIIALATCHNRCKLTLRSIKSILEQSLPSECSLEICLVDDGSIDGTGDAIRKTFPNVKILEGDGNLYWAGGMCFGWDNYVQNQDMDYLLVFNDDIELFPNSIIKLLEAAVEVTASGTDAYAISGAFRVPGSAQIAYGGVVRDSWWHRLRFKKIRPVGFIQDCDTLNMNLALISSQALNKVGFFSRDFTHAGADFDFGLRLRQAGGRVILAKDYMGECNINSTRGTSAELGISFKERWHRLTSIKEQPFRQRALYYRRHGGLLWPLLWVLPYLRIWLSGR